MNSLVRLKQALLPISIFAITVGILLRPWRNVVGQDDASYAFFSDLIKQGSWQAPDLLLAAAWPQAVMGAAASSFISFLPALSAYMLLTYAVYLTNLAIFASTVRTRNEVLPVVLWIISFFLFPVTLQYGTAFLTETYVVFFVLLYFVSLRVWLRSSSAISAIGIIAGTILIVLQRQSYLIFPGAALAFLIVHDRSQLFFRKLWPVVLGIFVALLVYAATPKTFLQAGMVKGMLDRWMSYPTAFTMTTVFVSRIFQLLLAVGIFLTPLVFSSRWTFRKIVVVGCLNVAASLLLYSLPGFPLTAGVLFTGYLPRIVGSAFIATGVWGLSVILPEVVALGRLKAAIVVIAAVVFLAFTAFFDASDVKYVLPASLSLLFVSLLFEERRFQILESRKFILTTYIAVVGAVSLLTNRYYLDTLDARFQVAQQLEQSGIDPRLVSAGYGRDSYKMGETCLRSGKTKIASLEFPVQSELVHTHLIQTSPRQYEDEAVFKFFVKPYSIFGKQIVLASNRLEGQSEIPVRVIEYDVFGLPNALAVYENSSPRLAWCFR